MDVQGSLLITVEGSKAAWELQSYSERRTFGERGIIPKARDSAMTLAGEGKSYSKHTRVLSNLSLKNGHL